jgi:hypothetical protein
MSCATLFSQVYSHCYHMLSHLQHSPSLSITYSALLPSSLTLLTMCSAFSCIKSFLKHARSNQRLDSWRQLDLTCWNTWMMLALAPCASNVLVELQSLPPSRQLNQSNLGPNDILVELQSLPPSRLLNQSNLGLNDILQANPSPASLPRMPNARRLPCKKRSSSLWRPRLFQTPRQCSCSPP